MKRKVQAQRKFAQGAPIPQNNVGLSERRLDTNREEQRIIIHNNTAVKALLDVVSFNQIHEHNVPVVLLERLKPSRVNAHLIHQRIQQDEVNENVNEPPPNNSCNRNTMRLRSHNSNKRKSGEDDAAEFIEPQDPFVPSVSRQKVTRKESSGAQHHKIASISKKKEDDVKAKAGPSGQQQRPIWQRFPLPHATRNLTSNMSDVSLDEDKPLAQYAIRKKRLTSLKLRKQASISKRKGNNIFKKSKQLPPVNVRLQREQNKYIRDGYKKSHVTVRPKKLSVTTSSTTGDINSDSPEPASNSEGEEYSVRITSPECQNRLKNYLSLQSVKDITNTVQLQKKYNSFENDSDNRKAVPLKKRRYTVDDRTFYRSPSCSKFQTSTHKSKPSYAPETPISLSSSTDSNSNVEKTHASNISEEHISLLPSQKNTIALNSEPVEHMQITKPCPIGKYVTFGDVLDAPIDDIKNSCKTCSNCIKMIKFIQIREVVDAPPISNISNENNSSDSLQENEEGNLFRTTDSWKDWFTLDLDILKKSTIHNTVLRILYGAPRKIIESKPVLVCSLNSKLSSDSPVIERHHAKALLKYLQKHFNFITSTNDLIVFETDNEIVSIRNNELQIISKNVLDDSPNVSPDFGTLDNNGNSEARELSSHHGSPEVLTPSNNKNNEPPESSSPHVFPEVLADGNNKNYEPANERPNSAVTKVFEKDGLESENMLLHSDQPFHVKRNFQTHVLINQQKDGRLPELTTQFSLVPEDREEAESGNTVVLDPSINDNSRMFNSEENVEQSRTIYLPHISGQSSSNTVPSIDLTADIHSDPEDSNVQYQTLPINQSSSADVQSKDFDQLSDNMEDLRFEEEDGPSNDLNSQYTNPQTYVLEVESDPSSVDTDITPDVQIIEPTDNSQLPCQNIQSFCSGQPSCSHENDNAQKVDNTSKCEPPNRQPSTDSQITNDSCLNTNDYQFIDVPPPQQVNKNGLKIHSIIRICNSSTLPLPENEHFSGPCLSDVFSLSDSNKNASNKSINHSTLVDSPHNQICPDNNINPVLNMHNPPADASRMPNMPSGILNESNIEGPSMEILGNRNIPETLNIGNTDISRQLYEYIYQQALAQAANAVNKIQDQYINNQTNLNSQYMSGYTPAVTSEAHNIMNNKYVMPHQSSTSSFALTSEAHKSTNNTYVMTHQPSTSSFIPECTQAFASASNSENAQPFTTSTLTSESTSGFPLASTSTLTSESTSGFPPASTSKVTPESGSAFPPASTSASTSKTQSKHTPLPRKSRLKSKTITHTQPSPGQSYLNAPVFTPTAEEFKDPVAFFESIMPIASKYGICKVVPPKEFAPKCTVSEEMTFNVTNQYVSRLFSRWGPGSREMSTIKAYLASQSVYFKRAPLYEGMEVNLPKLYQIVQRHGGLKKVIERKRWGRVAEEIRFNKGPNPEKKLDQFYVKYLLPYDTLSVTERGQIMSRVERAWCNKYRKMTKRAFAPFHRQNKLLGESESSSEEEDDSSCSDDEFILGALTEAEECVMRGRKMNLTGFKKVSSNALETIFSNPHPTTAQVEEEYWRIVLLASEHLCVVSANIDTGTAGYGFTTDQDNEYAHHDWNLKNLVNNPNNILRHLGPVMGVTIPTLHLGMVFSTSCWHRDPHGLPWIEYMHSGPPKIWYGIPDEQSSKFRKAVETLCPTSCQNKTIWLPSDIAMIPPNLLREQNVTLSRVEQNPGEYIIVFPKAYSSSISTGYTVSESVYFASKMWLQNALQFFTEAQISSEPTMISIDHLLLGIVKDLTTPLAVLQPALSTLHCLLQNESYHRLALEDEIPPGTANEVITYMRHPPGAWNVREQDECDICRKPLFLSRVRGLTKDGTHVCVEHAMTIIKNKSLDDLPPPTFQLDYYFTHEELKQILEIGDKRLFKFS